MMKKRFWKALGNSLSDRFDKRYIYEAANSAEEAMEVIDELLGNSVEVLIIVSDWLMPGIWGDELLVQVHQRYPQVVTVMLTGQADNAAIDRAREEANLYCCLQKPWTEEDLVNTIVAGLEGDRFPSTPLSTCDA